GCVPADPDPLAAMETDDAEAAADGVEVLAPHSARVVCVAADRSGDTGGVRGGRERLTEHAGRGSDCLPVIAPDPGAVRVLDVAGAPHTGRGRAWRGVLKQALDALGAGRSRSHCAAYADP